jgi:precorrin-6A synthase
VADPATAEPSASARLGGVSRTLLVIGIGAGDPDHLTVQAIKAINEAEVFFVVDKGAEKSSLVELRSEILRRHRTGDHRVVEIPDPPRDRGAAGYAGAVADWHEARARLFADAVARELPGDGTGAFLVWGDPALYDSTLRVIERMLARIEFDYRVIPGITSVQTLTAAHRITLNRIGEPIHITTGRRLAAGFPEDLDSVVVMLDAALACEHFADGELEIFWGAYLGTPEQVLMSGRLVDVAGEIAQAKRELREKHGWIMDTYLLRRPVRG